MRSLRGSQGLVLRRERGRDAVGEKEMRVDGAGGSAVAKVDVPFRLLHE